MSRRPAQQANPPSHSHYPPAVHAQAAPRASVQLQDPRTPVYYNATQPGYPIQPGYGPGPRRPPPPDPVDVLFHRISQILASYQSHTDARLNRIDNNIQKLTTELFSARSESRESVTKIAELLQTSHGMQTKRLRRLEDMLGFGAGTKDHQNQKSLGERFDVLSFAVEEFLERLRDPEANLPDGPLHHDMATSPPRHAYADAEASKTPISKRRFSVAVGSPPGALSADQSSSTLVPDESIFNKQPEVEKAGGDLFGEVISRNIPKTTFAAVSPVTRPLVPADWDAGSPQQQSFSFNPDRSPAGMAAYSVVPNRSPSVDGSIASLRQTALGNSVGPLMSTPRRSTSVHSVSPAPHVSRPHSSPRITPLALDTCDPPPDDNVPESPATPGEPSLAEDPPTRRPSVGVHSLQSARSESAHSRSPTGEPENTIQLQSPSADTLREELSVLDMMASPDALSNLVSPVSPVPLLRAESQPPIPSSVSPPMLPVQDTSPALRVVIPDRESTPTPAQRSVLSGSPSTSPATFPSASDLFGDFMSPLSSLAPSSVQESENASAPPPEPQPSASRTQSAKKRKAKAQGSESKLEGPPLKRARQRTKKTPSATGAGGSGKQGKGKGKNKIKLFKEEGEPVLWPAMMPGEDPEFVGQFIGCDKCERWYHYMCMAVVPGDSRLEGTFLCPLCVAGHPPPPKEAVDEGAAEQCSRPDCPVQDKFFELEGVFGRYTKLSSTHGRVQCWLVFWKGYKWKDATWEPTRQADWAVEEFERRAVEEGFDLDDDSCIILDEAKKGGVQNPEGAGEVE